MVLHFGVQILNSIRTTQSQAEMHVYGSLLETCLWGSKVQEPSVPPSPPCNAKPVNSLAAAVFCSSLLLKTVPFLQSPRANLRDL